MAEFDQVEILDRVQAFSGAEFERFVAALWELQGWTTEITETSGDDGRDIIAERNLPFKTMVKIEAKGWSDDNLVGSPLIRQSALLPGDDADQAVVVTSSSFTEPAQESARRHNVKLVDSTQLVVTIQKLSAEQLLTDIYAVDAWKEIQSGRYIDWTDERIKQGQSVDVIPGIGTRRREQLAGVDIHTVGDLLVANPESVAERTGFTEERVRRWSNLAAFYRGGEPVSVLGGIDSRGVEQLATTDIYTVDELRAACPCEVADQTTLDELTLKRWVGDAVSRGSDRVTLLPKIGEERAKELARAGIFTVDDLAATDLEYLEGQCNIGRSFLQELIRNAQTTS